MDDCTRCGEPIIDTAFARVFYGEPYCGSCAEAIREAEADYAELMKTWEDS